MCSTTATRLLKDYLLHRPYTPASLSEARRLFDSIPTKDVVLWTSMISAYAHSDQSVESFHLLFQMLRHGNNPNEYTYASAARAAATLGESRIAKLVHAQVIARGLSSNVVVGTSVVGMYARCNDVGTARTVFDGMPVRSAVTWNSMVSAFVNAGLGASALELFRRMRCGEYGKVDEFTIASVLTGCTMIGDLSFGVQVHCYSIKVNFEDDLVVTNAMGNMYIQCGEVGSAERVIEGREGDELSKLMMVKGYAFNRRFEDVIRSVRCGNLFRIIMRDCSVFVAVLAACANISLLKIGRQIHGFIITLGYCQSGPHINIDSSIITCTLIDMYYKCSSVAEALFVFDTLVKKDVSHWNHMIVGSIRNGLIDKAQYFFYEMPERNVISWTAVISGYTRHGMPWKGLSLLSNLHKEAHLAQGYASIFTVSLHACSSLAALDVGKQLHARAIRILLNTKSCNMIMLGTALVDMYSKSSDLNYARKVFDRMEDRNVVSWTSMITAYASHGLASKALNVFEEEILQKDIKPNEVTFVAVLNACRHCGLVEEGKHYFKMMKERYRIIPRSDHCACMVDMLARAGKLDEAWSLVEGVVDIVEEGNNVDCESVAKNWSAIWGALLNGCRLHGNLEMASRVAEKMSKNKHRTSDTYISVSNVYAADERWDKVHEVRKEWRRSCLVQDPGYSRVESGFSWHVGSGRPFSTIVLLENMVVTLNERLGGFCLSQGFSYARLVGTNSVMPTPYLELYSTILHSSYLVAANSSGNIKLLEMV